MTVLVTGAGGFVGSAVASTLLAEGRAVRGLDLGWAAGLPETVERVTGSVLDPEALARAMAGVSGVIHCAALSDLWLPDAAAYEAVNVGGTRAVARAAPGDVPMVHVSSATVLIGRATPPGAAVDETADPADLLGPYPMSKRAAETALAGRAAIVLPSAPVGPGDARPTPPGRMLRDLAAGRTPALLSARIDLVDVQALAAGIVAALDRGRPGRRYLMTGEALSLPQIAGEVEAATGTKAPRARVPLWVALAAAHTEAALSRLTGRSPAAPLTGVRLAARPVRFQTARAETELGFAPGDTRAALRRAALWQAEQPAP